jgi:hypothetical protein
LDRIRDEEENHIMNHTSPDSRPKNGNRIVGKRWFFVPLTVLLTAGCGGPGEVSGKVYYKGKPLVVPGGMVTFAHPTKGMFSGPITSDGSYTIFKVPPGEVKIAVLSLPPRRGNSRQQQMMKGMKSGKVDKGKLPPEMKQMLEETETPRAGQTVQLPPQYSDPEKSGLTYTVTAGKQTHDIELK